LGGLSCAAYLSATGKLYEFDVGHAGTLHALDRRDVLRNRVRDRPEGTDAIRTRYRDHRALSRRLEHPAGHGIGSVLRGGVVTAGKILGRDLMREVGRGDVLGDPSLLPELRDDYDPWRESH
jgi:hypothetical protein